MPSATCCLTTWALTSGSSSSWMFSPPAWFSMNAKRVRELPDVVVVGGHAGDERIATDRLRGALGQVADHQRVVIGPGRLDQESAQERLRRVREFQELEHREDPEDRTQDGEEPDRRDAGAGCAGRRRERQFQEPPDVARAEQREDGDDHRVDDEDGDRAWTKTCNRSPLRTATMPATPPRKMYVANSSEDPFTAPPMIAMTAMTIVASDASSRIARSMPMAAVGRKNWRMDRPAVILRASVAPTTSTPIRNRTLSRCHRPGRNRQIQASSIPTSRTASMNQPTNTVGLGPATPRPRASIFSMSAAVEQRAVADDDLALGDLDQDRSDGRFGAIAFLDRQHLAERRVRDDQVLHELGRPASARAASSPPAISPVRRVLVVGDLRVEQLGAQDGIEDAGGLRADRAPGIAIESAQRLGGRFRQLRQDRRQQRRPVLGRHVSRVERVDRGDVALEGEGLLGRDGDGLLAGEVVLRLDILARGFPGGGGLDVALEFDRRSGPRCRSGRCRRP